MIEQLIFTNLNNDSIELNTDIYPLHLYTDDIETRLDKRSKAGQDGMWPTFSYDEGMEIVMEGDILADDSDDYWTKRQALVSVLRYKSAPREHRSGVLYVTFDNAPEEMKADVALTSLTIPRNGASPAFSPYRCVLYSFTPYYVGVDTDGLIYES